MDEWKQVVPGPMVKGGKVYAHGLLCFWAFTLSPAQVVGPHPQRSQESADLPIMSQQRILS